MIFLNFSIYPEISSTVVSLMGCVSVSAVELALGSSATSRATSFKHNNAFTKQKFMKPCLYKLLSIYMGTPKSWLFSLTQHSSPALASSRGCHDKNPPPQIAATTAWNWRKRIEFAEELRNQKFMPWFTVLFISHQDSNAIRRQCRVGTVQLSKITFHVKI